MTNIDAGSQRIRRLPDRPIVGETYPNAGGLYKVDRYDAESDLAWVHRPKDGWKCCAHGPALYDVPGRGIGRMSIPVWNGITRLQAEHWLVLLALAVPLVMPPQMLLKVSALQETLYM